MATILDKAIVRESTVKVTGRDILITLGEDQTISMKLKGMKTGAVSISIAELYEQLTGGSVVEETVAEEVPTLKSEKVDRSQKDNPTISLYELRTKMATTPMSFENKSMFDTIIVSCIKEKRDPVLALEAAEKEAKYKKK